MNHPFLNWFEALVARWLFQSPRVGMVAVRQAHTDVTWVLYSGAGEQEQDTCGEPYVELSDHYEPASMVLERLYHSPDAQR